MGGVMEFPDWIREVREAADRSQVDLARSLGVTPGLVSQWETGKTGMPARTFALFVGELDLDPKQVAVGLELLRAQRAA